MYIRVSLQSDATKFVDVIAKWENTDTITATLPPNSFPSVGRVVVSVGVKGQVG